MLDINLVREQPDVVREALQKRNMDTAVVDDMAALDVQRRNLLVEVEALKAERNTVSREIGKMKDKDARQAKIDEMRGVADRITELDEQVNQVEDSLTRLVEGIPNIPDPITPLGKDESENVVVRTGNLARSWV
jgi:seryl-tRNA synthetase